MSSYKPIVLVYNPLAGHGHLDSWSAMVTNLLLQEGYKVIVLTPNKLDLLSRLSAMNMTNASNLQILEWALPVQNIFKRIYRKISGKIIPLKVKQNVGPSAVDSELNYLEPMEFAERIHFALSKEVSSPHLIINMYMDLYRTDYSRWNHFESRMRIPWVGLRFIPAKDPIEGYYFIPSCRGMAFLDEDVCKRYQKSIFDKNFAYFPDITDASLPTKKSELSVEILKRARGRKIVFLGGTIGRSKNLEKWYELISIANPERWFFLQIGEIRFENLTTGDIAAQNKCLRMMPENLLIKNEYLPDEKIFNDVIFNSDVLFAVYRDFKISSNMLGKAAAFERPILVAQGNLMGQRVNDYQIGIAVPEDNVPMMLQALEHLVQNPIPNQHFVAYREEFSEKVFSKSMIEFIGKCIQ